MRFSNSVAMRVEELLQEQLERLGVDLSSLEPHEISEHMHCKIWPDQTMVYSWKEQPILRIVPEEQEDGSLSWRMFTQDENATDTSEELVQ